jgi:hypothetical protein
VRRFSIRFQRGYLKKKTKQRLSTDDISRIAARGWSGEQ